MRKLYILYAIVLKYYIDSNQWNNKPIHSNLRGICMAIYFCHYNKNLITKKEFDKLEFHFESQRQSYHKYEFDSAYWFKTYLLKPRIKLLKELIEKTKPWYVKLINKITKK